MIKICFIGNDLFKREDFLGPGISVTRVKTISGLLNRRDDPPEVIIADRHVSAEPSFRDFIQAYKSTPKIVFSDTPSFGGFAPWLKNPLTYPVVQPSEKELVFLVKKALHEKRLIDENTLLRGQLDNMKKELSFFDTVSKTMTSSLDLGDIISGIMKNAKQLIRVDQWSVFLVDAATGDLVMEKTSVKKDEKATRKKIRLKKGEGISGWVAQEGIPIILPDVSKDKRFNTGAGKGSSLKAQSLMCVPILSKGTILGVFEIISRTTHQPFTREDLALFQRLVDRATIAIEMTTVYQKMAELSITDDLTKLFNTRYLNRTLEIELTRSKRHQTSLSLIFMDVDHFKTTNDTYGHLVGSKLLVEIGQLLIKSLRTIDIVARYGGDEFVIVLPQTAPAAAIQIAERIRRSIELNVFLKKDGYSLRLTASFGVASYPESAKTKEDLLRLADEAMYRVKTQTRNGVYAIV
ncbi:MAG: sensor domain-containing diguanylate cyclase [Nitrospirae bacterium]|nr:MAG: sensor domain-containing diguanylate cyclase [Nitrospirota bacterium]